MTRRRRQELGLDQEGHSPARGDRPPRHGQRRSFVGRRDAQPRDKTSLGREAFVAQFGELLDDIQANYYQRALDFQRAHTVAIDDRDAFYDYFTPRNADKPEIHGGFALAHWCGDRDNARRRSRTSCG
jgi:prolyl-tRNA synthetase